MKNLHERKKCVACGKEFTYFDFPHSFERMLTCGSTECMGKRRRERNEIRHTLKKALMAM